jgi:flagellar biosynthesis/type III secretory pathway protein FliH
MSELYKLAMKHPDIIKAVTDIIKKAREQGAPPFAEVLARAIADAYEDGVKVGLTMRCGEIALEVPHIGSEHNIVRTVSHTMECRQLALDMAANIIPGVVELPDAVADFGHKCFASGFDKGYSEGLEDGYLEGIDEIVDDEDNEGEEYA